MARRGPSIRSLPAATDDRMGMSNGSGSASNNNRPRATTEDATSAVINQWRNQTPLDGPYNSSSGPSLPRGASHASVTSEGQSSLRSSASSRQLKHRPSNEWSSIPTQHNSTSPGIAYAYGNSRREMENEDGNTPRPGVSRQASQVGSNNGSSFSSTLPTSMARGRSASSPNIYQQQPNGNGNGQDNDWSNSNSNSDLRMNGNGHYGTGSIPSLPTTTSSSMALSHKSGGTNSGGTLASASSISASNRKRFSSSSNGTDRSSGTSASPQPSVNGNGNGNTSPNNGLPGTLPPSSSLPPLPNGSRPYGHQSQLQTQQSQGPATSAVRVKVTFGEDTFVVVVLSTVSFKDLQEKVIKKIRLCGDRSNVDVNQLRLRYQDEDGDKILITSEEDVAMAFEFVKMNAGGGGGGGAIGGSTTSTLVLYATAEALA